APAAAKVFIANAYPPPSVVLPSNPFISYPPQLPTMDPQPPRGIAVEPNVSSNMSVILKSVPCRAFNFDAKYGPYYINASYRGLPKYPSIYFIVLMLAVTYFSSPVNL